MKESRIQKVAHKLAENLGGTVIVTYELNGESDTWDVLGENESESSYEAHLEEVFGDNWKKGKITKIEGLPDMYHGGAGTSIEDLFYMLEILEDRGYFALEAALDMGYGPSEMSDAFWGGPYDSLEEYGEELMELLEFDGRIPEKLQKYLSYEKYAEDNGYYVKASNGEIYAFYE